ncbi:hypothetical protein PFISCL1PPCAC_20294, partial [Pristionchus fissidentatus]
CDTVYRNITNEMAFQMSVELPQFLVDEFHQKLSLKEEEVEKYKTEVDSLWNTMKMMIAAKNKKIKELEFALASKGGSPAVNSSDCHCKCSAKTVDVKKEEKIEEVFEKTLNAKFTRISSLLNGDCEYLLSKPTRIAGVEWSIHLQKLSVKEGPSLSLSLRVATEGLNESWSCDVIGKFSLLSRSDLKNSHYFTPKFPLAFSPGQRSWGYPQFITIKDLLTTKNGYVKDDSIIVSIDVRAFPNGR